MPSVCVDASLVLMLLLPDEHSQQVEALWSQWTRANANILGPPLLYAEVSSVLREAVFFNRIAPDEGEAAFHTFCEMNIVVVADSGLHLRAWSLAKEFHRPRVYDAFYLAAAQVERCDLWTGDRRLVNSVNLSWVKWVGHYSI